MSHLTFVTNAIIYWHTDYMGAALAELRGTGRDAANEALAHIFPARSAEALGDRIARHHPTCSSAPTAAPASSCDSDKPGLSRSSSGRLSRASFRWAASERSSL
ncbi:Tn3 family transposase [Streptomyces coffeae]|uniref:Tn3 family transposase n=1 Tax=Streptomyces coffeae TaxID=621382 RepID=A0ABS1NP03_9ACTN|nr:Tn3 family transposase [Streptomyces coffeae]